MKEKIIVNIISLYSPGVRLKTFLEMIDVLQKRKFKLSVVLQNYPINIIDELIDRGIDVLTCKAKNPARAENEFLKNYYDSEYDYFIMLHDDLLLSASVKTPEKDFINYFLKEVKKLKNDEVVITLQENSFVFRNLKKPTITSTMHFWEPAFILVNIYKKFKVKVFFNSDIDGVEGTAFSCDLFRKGFKVMSHYGQATFKQLLYKSTYGDMLTKRKKLEGYRKQIYELNKDIFMLTKNNQLRRRKDYGLEKDKTVTR